jgi:hypothetical protein
MAGLRGRDWQREQEREECNGPRTRQFSLNTHVHLPDKF